MLFHAFKEHCSEQLVFMIFFTFAGRLHVYDGIAGLRCTRWYLRYLRPWVPVPTFLRGGAAFYPNDAGKGLPVSSPSFSPLVELHFREEVQWVPLPEWHVHPIQQALRRPAGLLGWR